MEESEDGNNGNEVYQKEKMLSEKLKEELFGIYKNNIEFSITNFNSFVDKLINIYYEKRIPLIREYCLKNYNEEESKIKVEKENEKINSTSENLKRTIINEFESLFNNDLKELNNNIDEIFNTDDIDPNIKLIYNNIKNNEYSSDNIDKKLNETMTQYEETFRKYLLYKMKYKEELEIYNNRQNRKLNENIDSKKDFNDINNYLDNFKIDVKANSDYEKLKNLLNSLREFNINNPNNQ